MKSDVSRLLREKRIRIREKDRGKIKSLIESAKGNVEVVLSIALNEKTSTVVFREIYESIRQLGDAKWWTIGYEPLDHSVSLDSLRELDIKDKIRLNFLERFKEIRHAANYRGFKVSVSQTKEIIDFWKSCSKDIINVISSKV